MSRSARLLFAFAALSAVCCLPAPGPARAETGVITASLATPTRHWWEEHLWLEGARLDGRSIEIAHVGAAVYVDYIRFVNVETGREVVWTDFASLWPGTAVAAVSSLQEYNPAANVWAIRRDNMAHIGGGTLYAGADGNPPPVAFNPGLTGRYDIYVGVRATHFPVQVRLRLIETPPQLASRAGGAGPSGEERAGEAPHHVIIDDEEGVYFAWPSIARGPGGELLVVSYAGEAHTHSHGRVVLYRSYDGGLTWDEGTVVADTILDDRDPGILVTSDGTIIVSSRVAWWPDGTDSAGIDPAQAQALLARYQGGYLIRSTDGGRTWSDMFPYPFQPKGPIELADGRLFAVGKASATTFRAYVSQDLGETWQPLGLIGGFPEFIEESGQRIALSYWEPHFVETAPGKIVVFVRAHPAAAGQATRERSAMWLATSEDGGRTWSRPVPTEVYGYPPHALRLRDGRILLTYGHRWHPYGQRAQLSDDGVDFTKYRELIIRADAFDGDLGYPSSIELDDGRILTVYYQKASLLGKPALIATIWRLDEQPSDLWIGSPKEGAILTDRTPVHLATARPAPRRVTVALDVAPLYEGADLPAHLELVPWALAPGLHRLDVEVVDDLGATHQRSVNFHVEHVRVQGIERGARLAGDVPILIEAAIPAGAIRQVAVTLGNDQTGVSTTLYDGPSAPPPLLLNTLELPDGPYQLTVRSVTAAGVESVLALPVTVANWTHMDDAILPPSVTPWFGTIDRLRAVHRSDGWEFAGGDDAPLFGDPDRIRLGQAGEAFLVWRLPRLRAFALTVYAPSEAEATGSHSALIEAVHRGVLVEVSADQQRWEPVAYKVSVAETAAFGGEVWAKVTVTGDLPAALEAEYIRVTFRATAKHAGDGPKARGLELGHVKLTGRL